MIGYRIVTKNTTYAIVLEEGGRFTVRAETKPHRFGAVSEQLQQPVSIKPRSWPPCVGQSFVFDRGGDDWPFPDPRDSTLITSEVRHMEPIEDELP